jgi:hypothetical protein
MEYFKNVMLKLFETGEAESLLPVVAQVLQFSPSELARCRTALHARSEQVAASNAASECRASASWHTVWWCMWKRPDLIVVSLSFSWWFVAMLIASC